ncbi:MAG: DUF748 domain-containing protein [Steroidobacteraceae bacterium]
MSGVRGRRYLGLLAILAGLVGLYAAVGFLLVPRWTRSELVGLTARDFGRTLSVGDVSFNPFTWILDIRDFSLPDADGRPMISFGRLEVAVGFSSVTRLAPSLNDIDLESPRVSVVVRRDGKLNLADLEKPFAQPAGAKAPPPTSKPLELFVDRLAVTGGSATYEDDSRSTPFRLDLNPIGFELLGFSTTGTTAGSYHLTATIGQGGRLNWTGTIRTAPISLHGTLELDELSARTVGTYLGPVLPAEISRGTLALHGGFAIDGAAPGATAQGVRMTIDVPQAQVSGLGVRPRQGASDYVQLNRFTLGNAHIDLEQRSIRVGSITLAGADVRGWLDEGGKLNLLELLGRSAAQPQGSPAAPGGPPPVSPPPASHAPAWRIAAPDIRIEDTRVSLEDRAIKPAANLTLSGITARITGYDSSPQSRITVSVQTAVNGKGKLRLTAAGALQPAAVSAKLELGHVDLRALQPYLNKYTALTLASGFLSTALDIDRRADGQLDAAGRIDVAGLRAVDDDLKQDFVKWQDLHVVGLRYVSKPASLRIQHITAVGPYARVIIGADHTDNVSEALHPRGAHPRAAAAQSAQAAAPPPGGKPAAGASTPSMAMTIGLVRIVTGTADYADFSMQPNFATGIQDLHGTIEGLSSDPSSRANVSLKGKVDRYAPVDISGVVNLLSATTYTDISMKFRGLELTRMTPYAVRFAGYKIASGTLDADLHYKVDHGTLNADHTLVIDQLQLGDQVPSAHATKLPLRLAVALLKDRDGVIRLGLPVTGSLNNPQFSLGPLIGKALLHLLEKAVTAPFALLGRAFGGGPDMNRIDFPPGSAALLPATQGRVAALAKALAQRPQLQLQVPAAFAPDIDRPALAKRKLRDELIALARSGAGAPEGRGGHGRGRQQAPRPAAGKEVLELPGEHYRLLRVAYQNAFGPKAPLPASAQKVPPYDPAILEMQAALLKRTQVSAADLQALGERRAEAIRSAILAAGGVAAGRIAITAGASQPATAGQVAVKLGLK